MWPQVAFTLRHHFEALILLFGILISQLSKKSEYQLLSDKKISLCQLLVIRDQLNSTNVTESLHSTRRRPKIYCVTNRGISHLLPLVKLSLVDLFQYVAETVCFSSLSVCIILLRIIPDTSVSQHTVEKYQGLFSNSFQQGNYNCLMRESVRSSEKCPNVN